jgi:kynurenine 3-monooxygenase
MKKRAKIVGAGLVGSLWSIFLSRRGYGVEIFERRPDMRSEKISAGRSINLAISVRGLHALDQVGLKEKVLEKAVPMRGRMMHAISGETTFQRYGMDDSQCINSISRGELNRVLMTEAEKYGVKIHFQHAAADLSLLEDGVPLFGTDGAGSAVRRSLMQMPQAKETQDTLDYGYKELTIPPGPTSGSPFLLEKNALHIWPRGSFMLIALPNFDGSFTCTLFLPHKKTAGVPSFEDLKSPGDVENFFQTHFKDAKPLIENLTDTFFSNPTGHMVTVRATPWNMGQKALLLGDAAHAIVPFFGQGMNCGFEDCTILDEMMGRSQKPVEQLFEEFSQSRKKDADAIADLALENFIEMRDRVGQKEFLLMKEVESVLQKEFSGRYISRYSLVSFSRTPYSEALALGQKQNLILSRLCEGLNVASDVDLKLAHQLIEEYL